MKKKFIRDISQIVLNDRAYVACIGFFDGLHLGHQALINQTKSRAKDLGIESMLITFDPDPWSVLNKKSNVKHITPLKKKLQVIESFGIDNTVILHFDSDFSNLSPQDFVERV
ncbi:MAG TPA: bifunctional riboflavin kinase/FMN adenylyltransferase, partial [Erysipelothrix sp.]|nr:bifunctional riboflavin kinase/FMN adenylyltransferase [Erysipelothrix sp.]